jgi:cysteine protease ATG4
VDEARLKLYTETLFRFTYRRNMPALCGSGITSDSGWGCMLRAAQMLMGNTLQRHHLGKGTRITLFSIYTYLWR